MHVSAVIFISNVVMWSIFMEYTQANQHYALDLERECIKLEISMRLGSMRLYLCPKWSKWHGFLESGGALQDGTTDY